MGKNRKSFIESKILHLVRNFLAEKGALSSQAVMEHVLDTSAEFKRKPQNVLRKMVERAMENCKDDRNLIRAGQLNSKKRRINDNESSSESPEMLSEDEIKAREQELRSPGHNLLNASISGSYIKSNERKMALEKNNSKVKKRKKTEGAEAQEPSLQNNDEMKSLISDRPSIRYSDLGGMEAVLTEVRELLEVPLKHPEIYTALGVTPPRGVLLHGPPGCGKTLLACAIAGELGVSFMKLSAPEVVSGMSGESEQKIRELFQQASVSAPTIIFLDEIDAITPKRETSQRGMDKRIVAQLLTCMDNLGTSGTMENPVIVIGATNRVDALDMALRRAGRFDREIALGVPTLEARSEILAKITSRMKLSGDFDFQLLAQKTPGYVGADLASLAREAGTIAINRIIGLSSKERSVEIENQGLNQDDVFLGTEPIPPEKLEKLHLTMEDFLAAVKKVQPSAKREGFATVPDVTWADIGALQGVREELSLSVLEPIAFPDRFVQLGLQAAAGVLLYGPPGCGKTLLAKAVANESGANFISVKGPELLDKYVGQSERSVRQVFERARASSPCIIFFDELDSLCPRRGAGGENGGVTERVVNQLLTEMDGLEMRRSVWVIAATNRPELIDPAMLRPGRLDKLLYVPLPSAQDRVSILQANVKIGSLAEDVDLEAVALDSRAEGFSGADLAALAREAGLDVLRRIHARLGTSTDVSNPSPLKKIEGLARKPLKISMENFNAAFDKVLPSVSRESQKIYEMIKGSLRKSRAASSDKTV